MSVINNYDIRIVCSNRKSKKLVDFFYEKYKDCRDDPMNMYFTVFEVETYKLDNKNYTNINGCLRGSFRFQLLEQIISMSKDLSIEIFMSSPEYEEYEHHVINDGSLVLDTGGDFKEYYIDDLGDEEKEKYKDYIKHAKDFGCQSFKICEDWDSKNIYWKWTI